MTIKKKFLSLFITISILLSLFSINNIVFSETPGNNSRIVPIETIYIWISQTSASLKRGEGVLLTASTVDTDPTATVAWTSSDETVATVSDGYVVGCSAGTAVITAIYDGAEGMLGVKSASCQVTVSSEPIFENGTYFIENLATSRYIDIESPYYTLGANIQLWELTGGNSRKWNLSLQADGHYIIESYLSNMNIGVSASSLGVDGATIHQYSTFSSNYVRWSFMLTDNGNYAIIPKSGENMAFSLCSPSASANNGANLTQKKFTEDADLSDEWKLHRMLPLSGSELVYGTGNWTNSVVRTNNNCYSYAINCQLTLDDCFDELMYIPQQPGDYYGNKCSTYASNNADMVSAVTNDFNAFFGETGHFTSIGRYEICPPGSYKVALVIDTNYPDYHWYRQDSDGLWSHKPGRTAVTRNDGNNKLIIDPQCANRTNTSAGLNYSVFVGYFSVTPWNYVCTSLQPEDTSNVSTMSVANVNASSFDQVAVGMTMAQTISILGSPGTSVGSGEIIIQYACENGLKYNILYSYNTDIDSFVVAKIIAVGNAL